jgi:catechol 2,3-dioxygenase-like lactoylglutathione lyase family enzyme
MNDKTKRGLKISNPSFHADKFLPLTYPMIQIKRLDHIQLCIPIGKEEEARKFYTDILGFKEIMKPKELIPNGGLWYQVADIQLHLGTENELNQSKRHPAFEVDDIFLARQYLEGLGIVIKNEIPIPEQDRFSFKDPFGNRIEFLQKFDFPR